MSPLDFLTRSSNQSTEPYLTREEQGPKNAAENWDQAHQPDEEIRASDQAAKEGHPQPQARYETRDVKAEAEQGVEEVKSKVSSAAQKADTALMDALGHDGVEEKHACEVEPKDEPGDDGVGVESEKVKNTVGDALASAKETLSNAFGGGAGGKKEDDDKVGKEEGGSSTVEKVKSDLKTTASDASEAVREGTTRAADLAQQNAEAARESARETTNTAVKNAQHDAEWAADVAQKKAEAARESTKDATNSAMEKAQEEAEQAADEAQKKADAAQESAEKNSKTAMDTASEYSQQLKESISEAGNSVMNSASEMYKEAKETVLGSSATADGSKSDGNKAADEQKK